MLKKRLGVAGTLDTGHRPERIHDAMAAMRNNASAMAAPAASQSVMNMAEPTSSTQIVRATAACGTESWKRDENCLAVTSNAMSFVILYWPRDAQGSPKRVSSILRR